MKWTLLALLTWIAALPVFAGGFDVTTLPASGGDLSAVITQAEADHLAAAGGSIYTGNVALISQTGNGNYAAIDQGGAGNFYAISQTGDNNYAYINLSNTGGYLVVSQTGGGFSYVSNTGTSKAIVNQR